MEPHTQGAYAPHVKRVLSHLSDLKGSAGQWAACCPSHDDQKPSLSISLGRGNQVLLHCHAGCSTEAILEAINLTMADLFPNPSADQQRARQSITLIDFARDKRLPQRFLIEQGIVEEKQGLRIPYRQMDGTPAARHRIRNNLAAKDGSWWTKGPGKIIPYGLEGLENARHDGHLILVEGETDRLTLHYYGYHALGIPGAEMVKTTLELRYLEGISRLYIFQEPDKAGEQFVRHVADLLQTWKWQGTASVVTLPDAKDPNELHVHNWQAFKSLFQQALDHAKPLFQASAPTSTTTGPKERDLTEPISLQQLLEVPFAPLHWTIPGLLPEGLLLLVGKPKQGKSWLALQLAIAVASGGTVLGSYQVSHSDVLYLALEDTPQRLQVRTKQLLAAQPTVPTGLEFAVQHPRADAEGQAKLEAYIQAHPQLGLIIIDTWSKLAPLASPHARTQYEVDYASLAPLKQLADTHHLSILVIHHLRKSSGQDVLDQITGTTGLTGAVDEILLLKRERDPGQAALFITGRDIQEQTLSLAFHPTTSLWTATEDAKNPDERSKE